MPSLAELIMVKRFPEKDYDTGYDEGGVLGVVWLPGYTT